MGGDGQADCVGLAGAVSLVEQIRGPAGSIQMIAGALRDCLPCLRPHEGEALCEAIIREARRLSRLAEELSNGGQPKDTKTRSRAAV